MAIIRPTDFSISASAKFLFGATLAALALVAAVAFASAAKATASSDRSSPATSGTVHEAIRNS